MANWANSHQRLFVKVQDHRSEDGSFNQDSKNLDRSCIKLTLLSGFKRVSANVL